MIIWVVLSFETFPKELGVEASSSAHFGLLGPLIMSLASGDKTTYHVEEWRTYDVDEARRHFTWEYTIL